MEKSKNEKDFSFSCCYVFYLLLWRPFSLLKQQKRSKSIVKWLYFLCHLSPLHHFLPPNIALFCFVLTELFFYPQLQLVLFFILPSFPSACVLGCAHLYHQHLSQQSPFSSATCCFFGIFFLINFLCDCNFL